MATDVEPCEITSIAQFVDLVESVILTEARGQADRVEFPPAMHALWPAGNRTAIYCPDADTDSFDFGIFPELVRRDRPALAVVVLCGMSLDLPAGDPRVDAIRNGALPIEQVPSARHSLLLYGAAASGEEDHRLYYAQGQVWVRVLALPADYRHPLAPLYRPGRYDA